MNILQISTADTGGGAEKVAANLFKAYNERGHHSWLAVGLKRSSDSGVIQISNGRHPTFWGGFCRRLERKLEPLVGRVPGVWRVAPFCEDPRREIEKLLGIEDFNYPATRGILRLPPTRPDVIHCHNLHPNYFDLRELPKLSREAPMLLTLHDAWLMSGHCAHSLDCERWKIGCGLCPDLNIYPAIQRDATAYNWKRKRQIFARSQFYVATPSEWLMRKVKQSILAPAILEARVIPNGVDTSVFRPGEPEAARASLGIPRNCRMLLFTANKIRRNVWKDYETMKNAITRIGRDSVAAPIIFVALGEEAPTERVGYAELRFVPYQNDTAKVAAYYQAADLYIHAARADTFPNTVLEALACGTPVVATAVGGIPEQIKGLSLEYQQSALKDLNQHGPDEATGAVVPMGDADAMADTITRLVDDEILLRRLSANAVRDVRQRFDLSRQIENYLNWYKQLVKVSA